MKTLIISLYLFLSVGFAGDLSGVYLKSYGNSRNPSLIYVHGGPGFHSWDFELTTAQKLADQGYYVVVYDQRGQGRSKQAPAKDYNYQTYADDIKSIIDQLSLKNPVLLGHSHGGPIAIRFDVKYPGVAKAIVLIGAPINFSGSLKSIFENCAYRYQHRGDKASLEHLTQLYQEVFLNDKISRHNLERALVRTFIHGGYCGLYQTSQPTSSETELRLLLKNNPVRGPLSGEITAMPGFLANENYIRRIFVDHVASQSGRYFGIYGDEDGLFTPIELAVIRRSLNSGTADRYRLIRGASHSVYIDQQAEFFATLKGFLR